MTPSEIVSFIKERDGKLTDEEREMLSAICRAKIAQCDQALAAGADLVPKLQVIKSLRRWEEAGIQLALLAALCALLWGCCIEEKKSCAGSRKNGGCSDDLG